MASICRLVEVGNGMVRVVLVLPPSDAKALPQVAQHDGDVVGQGAAAANLI